MLSRLFCTVFIASRLFAQLDVPFLAQVPPPDSTPPENIDPATAWSQTHNCGQTSALMVMAYYSHHSLSEQNIRDVDDYLFQQFEDSVNHYYGSFTGGTKTNRLISVAQAFDHGFGTYSDTTTYSATINQLQAELGMNHPVMVGVWTDMCVNCLIRRGVLAVRTVPHWMVLTGITDSHVYVNDPGHSDTPANHPKNHEYTRAQFEAAWRDQGSTVVVIHPAAPTQVQWLTFWEGNPGIPGDGQVITAGPNVLPVSLGPGSFFEPMPAVSLAGATNGFTLTVFPEGGTNVQSVNYSILALNPPAGCAITGWGTGTSMLGGTLVFNGVQGRILNVTQQDINFELSVLNQATPGCVYTLAHMSLAVFYLNFGNTTKLDAAAFAFGQNAFP
jgi:hypothetical protein